MKKKNIRFIKKVISLTVISALLALTVVTLSSCSKKTQDKLQSSEPTVSSKPSVSSKDETVSSLPEVSSSEPETPSSSKAPSSSENTASSKPAPADLDPNFTNLLLVNATNTLPEVYEGVNDLVSIEAKYINGSLNQINKDVWPYMKAMIDTARSEGAMLYVRSPYRSYQTQNMLYQNKVKYYTDKGYALDAAQREAATVVAKPGTSEHQTGLCADFNKTNDGFERSKEFAWLEKNAENYGFILRYTAEKKPITGIIHESWHWRFVGINAAKEMNDLGMCLEEYVEYIENQKQRSEKDE